MQATKIQLDYHPIALISLAWGVDFALILVLFLLQARVRKCKSFIMNVFCDNFSLVNLSCGDDLTINNVYGLAITAFMHVTTVTIQSISFIIKEAGPV